MKLFKIYLIIFSIVASVIIISRFFPHTYKVERNITINLPVAQTFAFMSNYHNWEQWSLWNKSIDSTLIFFYNRKQDTIGARQYFNGSLVGQGYFETTSYHKDTLLQFKLSVNREDRTAAGTFKFEALNANQTNLTWIDSGDVGNNPIKRFMIPFVTDNTAKTLDKALTNIKREAEKTSGTAQ